MDDETQRIAGNADAVGVVQAKDLGTWGEMYPIAEQDMLTTIQTRLKAMEDSGELAREQDAFKQRVIEHTLRPKPVEGLTLAQGKIPRITSIHHSP